MKNKITDSYHFYALTTIFCWSLAYVYTRLALAYFSPFALGFLRYFVASCTLVAVLWVRKMPRPRRADLKWFLASGLSGFALYIIFFNLGCQTVSAATSSVVIATAPAVTALMAGIFYKEKLSRRQWLAIGLEFLGVVLLTVLDGIISFNIGLLWLIIAVLCFSTFNMAQRRLSQSYNGLQTSAYSILAGTLMLSVFLPRSIEEISAAPPEQYFYLFVLGVVSGSVAYAAWAEAYAKAPQAALVSNYMFLTPFITTLLGLVLINEKPDLPTLAGGAVILLGLAVFYSPGWQHKHKQKSGGGG